MGASFGIQGFLDQAMSNVVGGVLKTGGGFISGAFKGIGKMDAGLHNKSLLGKVSGGLGYGLGRVAGAPIRPLAKGAAYVGGNITKSIPGDIVTAFGLSNKLFNGLTTEAPGTLGELGIGLAGRRIKRPAALALSAGAIGLGAAGAIEDHSYNFGLKTAVNGMMDTQGVAVTPGSVNQSYTPIHRKPINNHGATGQLGFALHNQRRG